MAVNFGNQPSSWNGYSAYQSTRVQVGADAVVPAGQNRLTGLGAYFAREGGAGTATLCAWRGSTLIASVNVNVPASGGQGPGLQSWVSGSFTGVAVTAGETLRLGWQRPNNAYFDWSWVSGGTHWVADSNGGAWYSTTGAIGVYGVADVASTPPTPTTYYPSVWTPNGWVNTLRINGQSGRLLINATLAQRPH